MRMFFLKRARFSCIAGSGIEYAAENAGSHCPDEELESLEGKGGIGCDLK